MRILGDINPRQTARFNASVVADQGSERPEQFDDGQRDISDVPLKITDERYRLECDRLREDEAWHEIRARRARSSVAAVAVEEPEEPVLPQRSRVPEVNDGGSRISDAPLDLGSVSNELTQEHRQMAATELFAGLGYAPQPSRGARCRAGASWTMVLVLILALGGLAGYGYLAMRENGIPAWRLPGVRTAIALHQRLNAVESRASADAQAVRERSDRLMAAGRERWARLRR